MIKLICDEHPKYKAVHRRQSMSDKKDKLHSIYQTHRFLSNYHRCHPMICAKYNHFHNLRPHTTHYLHRLYTRACLVSLPTEFPLSKCCPPKNMSWNQLFLSNRLRQHMQTNIMFWNLLFLRIEIWKCVSECSKNWELDIINEHMLWTEHVISSHLWYTGCKGCKGYKTWEEVRLQHICE